MLAKAENPGTSFVCVVCFWFENFVQMRLKRKQQRTTTDTSFDALLFFFQSWFNTKDVTATIHSSREI